MQTPARTTAGLPRRGAAETARATGVPPDVDDRSPGLVIAVPGAATAPGAGLGYRIADMIPEQYGNLPVRAAFLAGDTDRLHDVLTTDSGTETSGPARVVVPLIADPRPDVLDTVDADIRRSEVPCAVGGALAPDPLLAAVLHGKLVERGLAPRRIQVLNVSVRLDGFVLGFLGGDEARETATMTATLLAARLSSQGLAAPLDDPDELRDTIARLAACGSTAPVLVPGVLDSDPLDTRIAASAEYLGVRHTDPIGAHPSITELVMHRYLVALDRLGPTTAPVG